MSPPAWAYQVDYFNPPPDEELVCSICQSVFCDPVQSPCNHVFCRNCIAKWLESNRNCPICRKRTTRSTLQEVVPIVKNMIMKLTLRCHNSERGCKERFSLESCESHVKECPYEMVQCKNKPCTTILEKRDIASHEQSDCYYSYVRCATCELKISSRNPQTHNCIEELQKRLKEKTEKLKKNNQKIKKLKEELKKLRANYASDSSSTESLSPADILFSFDNSHLSGGSSSVASSSIASDSADEDGHSLWTSHEEINAQLQLIGEEYHQVLARPTVIQQVDDSIEFPRSSDPLTSDDSSVLVVEPAEPVIDDEPQIRRPAKRRLNTRVFDSTDEEDGDIESASLPSRKRTWQLFRNGEGESSAAAQSIGFNTAGPSYLSSTADSSTSTNDSSPSSNRNKFKLKPKLRSNSTTLRSSTRDSVAANSTSVPQSGSPIFERTISLLEQYNLESDPEWLPTHEDDSISGLDDSDEDLYILPGHITSSDESSISEFDSDSSYEDAAEGRTEDLLHSFYASSDDSEEEWQPPQ